MCQACLEAELWLAYQEDLAAREKAAAAATPAPATATVATEPPSPADPKAGSFACEEPLSK
jgi:hypothetical protein